MNQNPEAAAPKSTVRKRFKGFGKSALVAALGVGLLASGGTYANWVASESLNGEKVKTGEVSLLVHQKQWQLNGAYLSQEDLAEVVLSPGDQLLWKSEVNATVTGDNDAKKLEFTGVEELYESLEEQEPGASGVLQIFEKVTEQAGSGWVGSKEIDKNSSTYSFPISFELEMAPAGSSAYGDGNIGQNLELDLSQIELVLH